MQSPTERYKASFPNIDVPLCIRILEEHHALLVAMAAVELPNSSPQLLTKMKVACEAFIGDSMVLKHATVEDRPERIRELQLAVTEANGLALEHQQRAKQLEETLRNAVEKIGQALTAANCPQINDGLVDWVLRYISDAEKTITERAEKALKDRDSLQQLLTASQKDRDHWAKVARAAQSKLAEIHDKSRG